jgi:hypothetical protein
MLLPGKEAGRKGWGERTIYTRVRDIPARTQVWSLGPVRFHTTQRRFDRWNPFTQHGPVLTSGCDFTQHSPVLISRSVLIWHGRFAHVRFTQHSQVFSVSRLVCTLHIRVRFTQYGGFWHWDSVYTSRPGSIFGSVSHHKDVAPSSLSLCVRAVSLCVSVCRWCARERTNCAAAFSQFCTHLFGTLWGTGAPWIALDLLLCIPFWISEKLGCLPNSWKQSQVFINFVAAQKK